MKKVLSIYKCRRCNHVWEDNPGPTQCPMCFHLYIDWLNHKDFQ